MKITFSSYISILFFTGMMLSCAPEKLSSLREIEFLESRPSLVEVEICDQIPEKETDEVRIGFVIDISGSNNQNDPDRAQRYDNLINYLTNRRNNPNFNTDNERYVLVEFSEAGTLLNGGGPNVGPDQSFYITIDEMITLVTNQKENSNDDGRTPYQETFGLMETIVNSDITNRRLAYEDMLQANPMLLPKVMDYFWFFLSDGEPCSPIDGGGNGCNSALDGINDDGINASVDSLVKTPLLVPDNSKFVRKISLHTAFYNADANLEAQERLRRLAEDIGGGEFVPFVDGEEIDYSKFVNIRTRKVLNEVRNWYIENLNASWSQNQLTWAIDSDQDGVPDELESHKEHGCHLKEDCDDDGIRDRIEFIVNDEDKVCDDPDCTPSQDKSLCMNAQNQWLDLDGDLLRDCEEDALRSQRNFIDSNSDGVPDIIAARVGQSGYFIGANSDTNSDGSGGDKDRDGLSDKYEIQHGLPYDLHNRFLEVNNNASSPLKPYVFTPHELREHEELSSACEVYHVENLPLRTSDGSDTIRVTIFDQEKFGLARKFIRIGEGQMKDGKLSLTYKDFTIVEPVRNTVAP